MGNNASLLIKFGEEKNLKRFLYEGLLHCKSIKWFAEHEDGKLRGDEFESVIKTKYFENVVMEIREADNPNSPWKKLNVTNALYKEYYKDPLGNLFCMSMFPVEVGLFKIDKKFSEFGGHFILIHNQVEFFKRVKDTLNALSLGFCRDKVEYIHLHTHTGEKKLFQKDIEFSFQQEYRIHLHRDNIDTFELSIGSIEDIAELYNCEDFQGFRIQKVDKS